MKHNRLWIAALLFPISLGCGQMSNTSGTDSSVSTMTDEHQSEPVQGENRNPNKDPETLAEAVEVIKSLSASILEKVRGVRGSAGDVYTDLYVVGHQIELLPTLAEKSNLTPDAVEKVRVAGETILTAFKALDESFQGRKTKSLDDIDLEVQWSVKQLESVLGQHEQTPAGQ